MRTLSNDINALMQARCEVIVTTTYSHDRLFHNQPDRAVISARDLLVSEGEFTDIVRRRGRTALNNELLARFKGIPSLILSSSPCAVFECLESFFKEDLPEEFLVPAAVMLLLERGRIEDLAAVGCSFTDDLLEVLAEEYPQFGVNLIHNTFSTIPFALASAVGRTNSFMQTIAYLEIHYDAVARFLIEAGRFDRAVEIVTELCTEDVRSAFLEEYGWMLLDGARPPLLRSLLDSVAQTRLEWTPKMLGMDAWSHFIMGNRYAASLVLAEIVFDNTSQIHERIAAAVLGHMIELDRENTGAYLSIQKADHARLCHLDELEAQGSLCQMQCMATESGACCPYAAETSAFVDETCLLWNLIARAFLLAQGRSFTFETDAGCKSNVKELVEVFFALLPAQSSGMYRIALHVLTSRMERFAEDDKQALASLLLSVLSTQIALGVRSISAALLVRDACKAGLIETTPGTSSRAVERARLDASVVIRELLQLLGRSSIARILSSDDDECKTDEHGTLLFLPQRPHELASRTQDQTGARHIGVHVEDYGVACDRFPKIKIRMFGGFSIAVGDQTLNGAAWRSRRNRLFVSYLVLHHGCEVSRSKLQSMLWPQLDNTHARDNFYTVWKTICSMFPSEGKKSPYFNRNSTSCSINADLVEADIFTFEKLSRATSTQQLSSHELTNGFLQMENLYRDDLLSNEYGDDYIDWKRDWYRDLFVNAMVAAASQAIQRGDGRTAIWFASRSVHFGRLREDANRALMRSQLFYGQTSCAIETFKRYEQAIKNELGTNPSDSILSLYHEIKRPQSC